MYKLKDFNKNRGAMFITLSICIAQKILMKIIAVMKSANMYKVESFYKKIQMS